MDELKAPMKFPEDAHKEPGEDNMVLGNQFYGPTGANNDAGKFTDGETLEKMVLDAPTSFGGGVPSIGQQSPVSGYGDSGVKE